MQKMIRIAADQLESECSKLYRKVLASGFHPTAIVGIPTAGRFVMDAMRAEAGDSVLMLEAAAKRPTTTDAKKSSTVKQVASRLPTSIQRLLRALELHLVTKRLPRARTVVISDANRASLLGLSAARLLVVDDSVDTGATLEAVVKELRRIRPDADVKTAALAVSLPKLRVPVDFVLHNDVLIQGPWSVDG